MSDVYASADGPKRRPGLAAARATQKLLADRTGWPDGALAACWELENRYPGWCVSWMPEWPIEGFERRAGFYAWRAEDAPLVKNGWGGYEKRHELYGADAEELAEVLAEQA